MTDRGAAPPLAAIVNAGLDQSEAVAIEPFLFMAKDVSNAYLVTTADGDILINAGSANGAPRTRDLFAPHRSGPLRSIVLTQSHPDHFGGVALLREAGTQIIAEERYPETRHFYRTLDPFFAPRIAKLWATTQARQGARIQPEEAQPDLLVSGRHGFDLGGRRFELISTPGGETLDSLCVWMPDERIVFTGNLFGPIFLAMPFLNTIRGDKPRLVGTYLKSLEQVADLGADLLITGHGEPVRGADRIRADLDHLHAAVSYVNEATIAGMNAGKNVHQLMREISLPPELQIGEWHGNVRWAVRSIWESYAGWFHYDSTTSLYGVPRSHVDSDLVMLAGGVDPIAERAAARLADNQPLEALHLIDIALGAEPAHRGSLLVKRDALRNLLDASGSVNLSETMWLRSEIDAVSRELAE